MKKILLFIFGVFFFLYQLPFFGAVSAQGVQQQFTTSNQQKPIICGCPNELNKIYQDRGTGETCVRDFDTFQQDPGTNHLWVEDVEVTSQGKADERARQFIYWVVTNGSIDNHPVLFKIWSAARNVSYFFVILVAAVMGIGMIVGQRANFNTNIKLWPSVMRIGLILLFITFSASLVITIIQLSEILMRFFIENLGGKDLFNIYFAGISKEQNYLDFVGCRDLNIRVQESFKSEMMLLKLTNISYYVMGGMLILRKIILWFLLFVSPFLAILMPFVFIRNIGWIWIGVFFQWVFYGPLFALFLGALASIWKAGIPYVFDFSRAGTTQGYIYPTAINILYGGPAQHLAVLNNGNYVDTFVEYVITLLMLWAVTFFPWWLLRIFRDYCCEGIVAMKNILLSMYDQQRGTPPPTPGLTPISSTIGAALKIPREVEIPIKIRIETVEEIKKAKTEDISRSLNMSATHLADVANFESNKQVRQNVQQNLNYLQNPIQATTTTERQKYMNLRTELYNRALKNDRIAKSILSSISTSPVEQAQKRKEIMESIQRVVPTTKLVTIKVPVPGVKGKVKEVVKPPEKPIETLISVPPTVSIEDYEQVKKMWKQQYERGEVPVAENIKTREEWVTEDAVFITNTLNKLLSSSEELRQQGLDDIGYILPIFLINNLKGEELVVYLKAKLEAAKAFAEEKQLEKKIEERVKAQAEEELVEVPQAKEEEKAKEMTMEQKMEVPEEKATEPEKSTES